MEIEDDNGSFWTRFKCFVFVALGKNIWPYTLIHTDYWNRPYGISFTHRRDFPKLFKYDMSDIDDDIEVEMGKKLK